jgi:hypothetical protein
MSGIKKRKKKRCPDVKVKVESNKVKDTCLRPVAWCGLRKAQILVYSWIKCPRAGFAFSFPASKK